MVILIDTNIIIDHFISRQPHMNNAAEILRLCFQKKCQGYITAHSITNIFYILRKEFSVNDRKKMLLELCEFMEVAGIQRNQIMNALTNENFDDLEDCLQSECARQIGAEYIITRNITDFTTSSIPAILPEDFLKII